MSVSQVSSNAMPGCNSAARVEALNRSSGSAHLGDAVQVFGGLAVEHGAQGNLLLDRAEAEHRDQRLGGIADGGNLARLLSNV